MNIHDGFYFEKVEEFKRFAMNDDLVLLQNMPHELKDTLLDLKYCVEKFAGGY